MRDSVLLLGNYMPSVPVARSLARAGYRVIAGDGGEYAPVYRSRACHEVWPHPPIAEPERFFAALASFVERRPDVSVILPLQSRTVAFLATNHERVPDGPSVAGPEPGTVLTCIDKTAMYGVASEAGVPTQPWATARDHHELIAGAREIGYPCVVRPTRDACGPVRGSRKAVICADEAAIATEVPVWPLQSTALLVQRYVRGKRVSVPFAARRGRVLMVRQTHNLRTSDLDGTGLGVDTVSEPLDPRLAAYVTALIGALDYTGVGSAQFIVPRRGHPSFLEINPRIGLSVGRAQHLGFDMPFIACRLATDARGWQPPSDTGYPTGKRFAWTSRDLHSMRMALHGNEIDRHQAITWLARAINTAIRSDAHVTFDWRDPLPTIVLYRDLARIFIRPPD